MLTPNTPTTLRDAEELGYESFRVTCEICSRSSDIGFPAVRRQTQRRSLAVLAPCLLCGHCTGPAKRVSMVRRVKNGGREKVETLKLWSRS